MKKSWESSYIIYFIVSIEMDIIAMVRCEAPLVEGDTPGERTHGLRQWYRREGGLHAVRTQSWHVGGTVL